VAFAKENGKGALMDMAEGKGKGKGKGKDKDKDNGRVVQSVKVQDVPARGEKGAGSGPSVEEPQWVQKHIVNWITDGKPREKEQRRSEAKRGGKQRGKKNASGGRGWEYPG